jgi:hypothetical protein
VLIWAIYLETITVLPPPRIVQLENSLISGYTGIASHCTARADCTARAGVTAARLSFTFTRGNDPRRHVGRVSFCFFVDPPQTPTRLRSSTLRLAGACRYHRSRCRHFLASLPLSQWCLFSFLRPRTWMRRPLSWMIQRQTRSNTLLLGGRLAPVAPTASPKWTEHG